MPKPKLRIKLLNADLVVLSDRLVDQTLEFTSGPTEKHEGPICIEATLTNTEDTEGIIKYLERLRGNLPLPQGKKKYTKSKEHELPMSNSKEPHKELIEVAFKKGTDQVKLMEYLRTMNFRFVTYQHLEEMEADGRLPGLALNEKHKGWQFMIRLLKEAKINTNDKYDPQLIFGIKIQGKHLNKVKVYLYGKFYKTFPLAWPDKHNINWKKPEIMWKFPEYMTIEERKKWRTEHYKLQKDPELKASKLYDRWKDHVKALK